MSYLVLARKYRPQSFRDVVGQVPVVKTLQNSLKRQRIAHALLFSGVRGVGKTTLARIMAKAINCEGDTADRPCNTCSPCQQITQGQSLDLHEIDGASNRGIQEIRELKEKIRFMPTSSKYKIILIDEVHMLTTEAFNALLKTLEEPPKHVYFMFATTELHKIPITILSRCQRYELKRISAKELTEHFMEIARKEKVSIDPAALALIVREAEGSVRDGFSLLDQMFSFGDDTITHEDVTQVLGLTDRSILLDITDALLRRDREAALTTLEGAFEYGIDIKRFTTDLLECFRTLLLSKLKDCRQLIDLPEEEIAQFQELASSFSFETIHLKLDLLMGATEQLRHSSQPRLALETAFLKIMDADDIVPVSQLLGKIDSLIKAAPPGTDANESARSTEGKKKPEAEQNRSIQQESQQENITQPPSSPRTPPSVVAPPAAEMPVEEPPPPMDEYDLGSSSALEDPSVDVPAHPHTRDVRKDWHDFIAYVKERKVWMAQDLQRADTAKEIEGELHLHYNDPVTCTLLRNKDNRKILTEFVLDFFQKDLSVRFILPEESAAEDDLENGINPHKARQQLMHDPLVQMTVEIFNGQVGDIRIGEKSR